MKTRAKSKPQQQKSKSKDKTIQKPKKIRKKQQKQVQDNVKNKQIKNKKQQEKQQEKQQKKQKVQVSPNTKLIKQQIKQKKVQKKPQPKKYLHKNYQQIARIQRSKHQRIYLLTAQRVLDQQDKKVGNSWQFMVQGTSGSSYHVDISTQVSCTCIDFRMKQKPCKHIYFIVTQVAQNMQILDYFNNSIKISKNAYRVLDEQLVNRLKARMQKKNKKQGQGDKKQQIDLKDDTDCSICFTQMDKVTQTLEGCPTCKKYFHFECLSAWKKHNATCPLCRASLKGQGGKTDLKDPLGLLGEVNIEGEVG